MPALKVCGRRWLVASDDCCLPGLCSVIFRFAWIIAIGVVERASRGRFTCDDGEAHYAVTYLRGALVIYSFSLAAGLLLLCLSLRGTLSVYRPRRCTPCVIYIQILLFFFEFVWTCIGTRWAFTRPWPSCDDAPPFALMTVHGVVACNWATMVMTICFTMCACDCFGGHRGGHSEYMSYKQTPQYAARWARCLRCLGVFNIGKTDKAVYAEIAKMVTPLLGKVDFTTSDMIAGMVLVRALHKAEERVRAETLQKEYGVQLRVVSPQRTARSSDLRLVDPAAPSDECDAPLLDEACHYFKFVLASFGWPEYTVAHCSPKSCNMCKTTACVCCPCCFRFDKQNHTLPQRVVGDNCCRWNAHAMNRALQPHEPNDFEILHAFFDNVVYAPTFLVVLDHKKKMVVIAVRGTQSFDDSWTDCTADVEYFNPTEWGFAVDKMAPAPPAGVTVAVGTKYAAPENEQHEPVPSLEDESYSYYAYSYSYAPAEDDGRERDFDAPRTPREANDGGDSPRNYRRRAQASVCDGSGDDTPRDYRRRRGEDGLDSPRSRCDAEDTPRDYRRRHANANDAETPRDYRRRPRSSRGEGRRGVDGDDAEADSASEQQEQEEEQWAEEEQQEEDDEPRGRRRSGRRGPGREAERDSEFATESRDDDAPGGSSGGSVPRDQRPVDRRVAQLRGAGFGAGVNNNSSNNNNMSMAENSTVNFGGGDVLDVLGRHRKRPSEHGTSDSGTPRSGRRRHSRRSETPASGTDRSDDSGQRSPRSRAGLESVGSSGGGDRRRDTRGSVDTESLRGPEHTEQAHESMGQSVVENVVSKAEFDPKAFYTHAGFMKGALSVVKRMTDAGIFNRLKEHPTYKNYGFMVCGHSLGAGIAFLVSCKLRVLYPETRCWAFSPPAVASPGMVEQSRTYTRTIVNGKEIVPRCSGRSLHLLRDEVVAATLRSKRSKTCTLFNCCNPEASKVLYDPSAMPPSSRTVFDRHKDNLPCADPTGLPPLMLPPGDIMHIVKINDASTCCGNKWTYDAVWAPNTDFDRVVASPLMVYDHMPWVLARNIAAARDNVHHARRHARARAPVAPPPPV